MLATLLNYAPTTGTQTPVSVVQTTNAISGQNGGITAGQVTLTWGTQPQQGDLLVIVIGWNAVIAGNSISQYTGTTGWTLYQSNLGAFYGAAVFVKYAGASEPLSNTFISSNTTNSMWPVGIEIANTDSNINTVFSQFSLALFGAGQTTASTNPQLPGIVGCLPVSVLGDGAQTATVSSGWTIDQAVGVSSSQSTYLAHKTALTSSLSTSTVATWTLSSAASSPGFVVQFLAAPPPRHLTTLTATLAPTATLTPAALLYYTLASAALSFAGSISRNTLKNVGTSGDTITGVQSAAYEVSSNVTSLTINSSNGGWVPNTVGNTLLAFVNTNNAGVGVTVTPPSGWQFLGSQSYGTTLYQAAFAWVSTVSVSSIPFLFSESTAAAVTVVELSGVSQTYPVSAAVGNAGSGITVTGPATPIGQPGTAVLACFGVDTAATVTPGTGWSFATSGTSGSTNFLLESAVATNTTPLTATATLNASQPYVCMSVAVNNAAPSALNFVGGFMRSLTVYLATAAMSFVGSFFPSHLHTYIATAALSFAGSVAKFTQRALSAASTFTGSIAPSHRRYLALASAGLTFVGSFVKGNAAMLSAGSLSFSGSISRNTTAVLTAIIAPTGSYVRAVTAYLLAMQSFSGSVSRGTLRSLSAVLSFIGGVSRVTNRTLTASQGPTATLSKLTTRMLNSASATFSGSVSKLTSYPVIAAALSFVGNFSKTVSGSSLGTTFMASIGFAGSIVKQVGLPLTAALTFSGSINRAISYVLSAILAPTATLAKLTTRSLAAASLAFTGSVYKLTAQAFNAALTFVGSISRQCNKALVLAALTMSGSWSRTWFHGATLVSAGLSFAGSMTKQTTAMLPAVLAPFSNFIRFTQYSLPPAILQPIAAISKMWGGRLFSGSLSFSGSIAESTVTLPSYFMVLQMPTSMVLTPTIPTQELLTAQDSGIIFTVHTGGFQLNPYYDIVTLLIQYQSLPILPHTAYPMSINADGYTASYVLNGSEFPVGGIYNIQLQVNAGQNQYTSPNVNLRINSQLSP